MVNPSLVEIAGAPNANGNEGTVLDAVAKLNDGDSLVLGMHVAGFWNRVEDWIFENRVGAKIVDSIFEDEDTTLVIPAKEDTLSDEVDEEVAAAAAPITGAAVVAIATPNVGVDVAVAPSNGVDVVPNVPEAIVTDEVVTVLDAEDVETVAL